ncbi:hypothetical protein GTI62_01000 [Enterococcus faecalis]|nr:hypothetical protein [Enterococcus faecalis]
MKNQDKEKEVSSLKSKLSGWIFSLFVGCLLLNIGVKLLAEVWLPLLFIVIFITLLVVGYRVKKFKDWR